MTPQRALARLRRRSPVAQIAAVVFVLAVAALLHVHLHLQLIQAGYAVAKESRRRHELSEQSRKLRLELAMRRDPAVIERRAREELGMAPPDPRAIRVARIGASLASPAAASGPPEARP